MPAYMRSYWQCLSFVASTQSLSLSLISVRILMFELPAHLDDGIERQRMRSSLADTGHRHARDSSPPPDAVYREQPLSKFYCISVGALG